MKPEIEFGLRQGDEEIKSRQRRMKWLNEDCQKKMEERPLILLRFKGYRVASNSLPQKL